MAGAGNKSLKAALFEAGLGERPPDVPRTSAPLNEAAPAAIRGPVARTRRATNEPGERPAQASPPDADSPLVPPVFSYAVSSPTHELFKDLNRKPASTEPLTQSVVSPPPWMRAARRGRRRARIMNTFGWVMTLAVAGAIIGLTGHYLAVSPNILGVPSALKAMQARP